MGLKNPAIDGFFIDDNWSSKLMGDRADGTGDLNGSDVSDCGLSPSDMKDMKTSWITNMDTVKARDIRPRVPWFAHISRYFGDYVWWKCIAQYQERAMFS